MSVQDMIAAGTEKLAQRRTKQAEEERAKSDAQEKKTEAHWQSLLEVIADNVPRGMVDFGELMRPDDFHGEDQFGDETRNYRLEITQPGCTTISKDFGWRQKWCLVSDAWTVSTYEINYRGRCAEKTGREVVTESDIDIALALALAKEAYDARNEILTGLEADKKAREERCVVTDTVVSRTDDLLASLEERLGFLDSQISAVAENAENRSAKISRKLSDVESMAEGR